MIPGRVLRCSLFCSRARQPCPFPHLPLCRQSLDNLGHAGEEVVVAPGYARNFLVPTGRAAYATPAARAALKVVLPPEELRASARARDENMLRARVAEARLRFVRATNDGVSLYGSVTAADVVEALAGTASAGLRKLGLREKHVRMPEGGVFKAVGEHAVDIEAKPGVWCRLRVDIVST